MTIRICKLAEILPFRIASRNSGKLYRLVKSKVNFFLVDNDPSAPFTTALEPANTSHPGGIVCSRLFVCMILCVATFSKIFTSTVKRISVPMIYFAWRLFTYLAVQVNRMRLSFSSTPRGVETFCGIVIFGVPIPLHSPFIVGDINNCALTSRERNEAYRFVGRLVDVRSWFGVCHSSIVPVLTGIF